MLVSTFSSSCIISLQALSRSLSEVKFFCAISKVTVHQPFNAFDYSFIPLAWAECDDSMPFSWASSIPLCNVLFPATLLHQLFLHFLSPHIAIYFLVYLSILLLPNSHKIPFSEILFSSILCKCPNQCTLCNLIVFIMVGFLTLAQTWCIFCCQKLSIFCYKEIFMIFMHLM